MKEMKESLLTVIGEMFMKSLNKASPELQHQKSVSSWSRTKKEKSKKSKTSENTQKHTEKDKKKVKTRSSKNLSRKNCKDLQCRPQLYRKRKTVAENRKKIGCFREANKKLKQQDEEMKGQIWCFRQLLRRNAVEKYKAEKLTNETTQHYRCLAKKKAVEAAHNQRVLLNDPLFSTLQQKYAKDKLKCEVLSLKQLTQVKSKQQEDMRMELNKLSVQCEQLADIQSSLEDELEDKQDELKAMKASLTKWLK